MQYFLSGILMCMFAGAAHAGEYADSLDWPEPEYHFGAAAVSAGITIPALYWAYSADNRLGIFAASTLPPMIGYLMAYRKGLGIPAGRNLMVMALTFAAYLTYGVGNAGMGNTEAVQEEVDRTAADILRYGFFALAPLTLMDFIIVALPHEQHKVSLDISPDQAVLVYRF